MRITWCSAAKCSACAENISPVISRLGQNIIASPVPLVRTCTCPSTVSRLRLSIVGTVAWPQHRPPDRGTDQREQRRNDHGANDEGVQQDAKPHADAPPGSAPLLRPAPNTSTW